MNLPDGDPKKISTDEAAREKQETVGDIPVPPKYAQADFLPSPFWRLRETRRAEGAAREFPKRHHGRRHGARGLAGSDHLQHAQAVSGLYVDIRDRQGTQDDPRLLPLLAVLVDLLPWLRPYHGEFDPEFGTSPADSFPLFVSTEGQRFGKSVTDLAAWAPPPKASRVKKATAKRPSKKQTDDARDTSSSTAG